MSKTNTAPTMKDVAREAGVALGTVSKVVNGLPVGEKYAAKVEKAIKKLGYQVNIYAQGMKAKKTNTVALLIPNAHDPFFAEIISNVNTELMRQKYRMLLCSTESDYKMEQEYVNMVQQNKVDGIIGLTYNPDLVVSDQMPFVSIDRNMGPNIPCVACDNFAGGQMAAEKLAELGCRHVAFLRIGSSLSNEPNKRKAGFENGCLAKNLRCDMKILQDGEPLEEFETFLAEHLHDGRLDFDGLFCVTDGIAYFVIKMLQKMNLRVPEDVQVIGFDGVQMFGRNYICSTIVQPVAEIAKTCVRLLLEETAASIPPLICLPVTYAPGGTTKEETELPNLWI